MKFICAILLCLASFSIWAQDSTSHTKHQSPWFDLKDNYHKNRLYFYWGYNREFFTRSDIHFHGPGYDFTVYQVTAKDRQSKFSFANYFSPSRISIPQFNLRLGFYINHNIHVSVGYDHMKYVMDQDQTVKISGVIGPSVSQTYAGSYINSNRLLTKDFLRFEHTNGLNLLTIDVEYLLPIYHTKKDWLHLGWNFGIGGLFVVPKTEVHIADIGLDNRFHLAGYCVPIKMGPRVDIWKYFFVAFEVKAGYMHLPDVLIQNDDAGRADHNFSFIEYYTVLGLQYGFGAGKKQKK